MATLTVNLLGEPHLHSPGGPVACASRKSLGLFCYLALSGARHSRRELAKLFWGNANPEAARASLRTALLRLPAPLAEALVVDRDSIVVAPAIDLDATRFAALSSSDEIADLTDAASLYAGELLKGLDIDATVEFDDWLTRERARWRQAAQSLFDRLIERHRERARQDIAHADAARDAALAVAHRWQELEPAAEPAHRWLIRLYLESGRPDAAATQYETCRRELAVAAGRAPSEQTRALVEALNPVPAGIPPSMHMATPGDAEAAVVVPNLPGTPFFGRVEELAALEQLLLDPSCRLLTLQALGGMGKTRLASVLVNHVAPRFEQGAAWVALETVVSAAQLAQGIAVALQIDLPPQAEPAAALRAALRSQHRLLVLDNFEHLLGGPGLHDGDAVEFVLALLRDAPRLRLLVTSREVLGLQEEWIYELSGLPCPDADAAPGSSFAATDLFAQRARQAYAGFSAAAEWPHMARLACLVEGMPLALELAAAWVRTVPCGDLVAAIDSTLASLASRHRDRPRRHLNLEAVVSTSWALLDREQQRALAPLCVFVGGFTHESAAAVADAPLRLLSALVGKSLVQRRADGRLGLHELVRQFLRDLLGREGDELRQAQRRHATFFADLLVRHRAELDGARGLEAHVVLTHDLANLKAAAARWDLATQADDVAEAWLHVLVGRGQQRAALEFAELALAERLRPATKAQVWLQCGVARVGLGQGREAEDDLGNAATLARELGLVAVQANALVHLTLVGFLRDDVPFIEARLAELEPLLAQVDHPALHVRALFYRAMLAETRGDNLQTLARYQEALSLAERLGVSPPIQATLQTVLARAWIRMGRFDEAGRLLVRALPVHEGVGNQPRLAQALLAQAEALLRSGGGDDAQRVAQLARRSLAIHEQSGHPPGISAASRVLGQAMQALGRRDEARRLFARAADVASPALRGEAKVDLGLLDLESGALGPAARAAVECIDLALEHRLKSLRWDAALLASAVRQSAGGSATASLPLLDALLAEPDLPFACRRRAQALRDGAGTTPDASADGVAPLDDECLMRAREALQPFVLSEGRDPPGRRPGTPSTASGRRRS